MTLPNTQQAVFGPNPPVLYPAQPTPPQAEAEPNSVIIYPTVPIHEKDPAERVNVMIAMFNNSLRRAGPNGAVDSGFAQEIATAQYILHNIVKDDWSVQCGWHISRPLTTKEKAAGLKGDSQLVKVHMGTQNYREQDMQIYRELDMVFLDNRAGAGGMLTIVEAKALRSIDHSQMRPNVELARRLGGKVMYSVDHPKHEMTLRAAYSRIPEAASLPPLEVIVPLDETGSFGFAAEWSKRRGNIFITRETTRLDKWRFARFERPELWYPENTEEGTRYINTEDEG